MNKNTHKKKTPLFSMNLFVLALVMLGTRPICAQEETRTATILGAAEAWVFPNFGGHGIGLVALDVGALSHDAVFSTEFNTDTLRFQYGKIKLPGGVMELGFFATGEAVFSGLLPDYYRLGEQIDERGFNAHYVQLGGYLKAKLPRSHTLSLYYSVRKWFFSRAENTDANLVLPKEAWVFEPRLQYTYWRLGGGLGGRHRLFRRANGFAFGLNIGLDWRSDTERWGAYDDTVFDTPDPRNEPHSLSFVNFQWMKLGWQFHPKLRVQFSQSAAYNYGGDDLNRWRIGGMNPYVVPIQGAPWAAFLSEQFVSGQLSLHIHLFNETEAGLIGDIVYLDDPERTGQSAPGVQAGIGAFYDMAFGNNQLDFRIGWSPTVNWQDTAGNFAVFLAYGRNWTF